MESSKEIEVVAIHVDDGKGPEEVPQTSCAQLKESTDEPSGQVEEEEEEEEADEDDNDKEEEEDKDEDENEVAGIVQGLVQTIGDELVAERKRLRRIQRKKDGPSIVIPRVPERLRKGEEDAYEPSVLSIGPYHSNKPELQPMQLHKLRSLQKILNRNPNRNMNNYICAITSLEKRARSCYPENIRPNKSEFVKMLLLDGCFVVGSFLPEDKKQKIPSSPWRTAHAICDLLLLENQIPFFILQRIYELATPTTQDPPSFTRVAIEFFDGVNYPLKKIDMPPPPAEEIYHLLHLYHMYTLWPPESNLGSLSPPSKTPIREITSKCRSLLFSPISYISGYLMGQFGSGELCRRVSMVSSAMELNEAGVKLKVKLFPRKNLDVSFSSTHGVMEIPQLIIDNLTDSLFRNLVAFEQLYPNLELDFTTYVKFLSQIINTPSDVALLYKNHIIEHPMGSEKQIVRLFNSLARDTFVGSENYLKDLNGDVDEYCKTRSHRWRAYLSHNYFNNPWSVISLAAAVILLLLTSIQTYCSMHSRVHHSP